MIRKSGAILVLSGPSGSGKSSLCKSLFANFENAYFSVSTTTRAMRAGEAEGVHYHFVSEREFLQGIENDFFLEWAEVHGNHYGTSKKSVENALKEGKLVVFDIDIQGHRNIKAHYRDILTSVFITTPTQEVLKERLCARKTDDDETIQKRVIHAHNEMKHIAEFDFLIVNSDLEESTRALLSIAQAALAKPILYPIDEFITHWRA